jgi:hypothetical protein
MTTKYLSILQARCRPFIQDGCFYLLAIEFSPAYFARLKRELQANGHELILNDFPYFYFTWESDPDTWESDPVICHFSINDSLPGESFRMELM